MVGDVEVLLDDGNSTKSGKELCEQWGIMMRF